ncbi:hypothetical protein CDD82_794 [Ophiocordyceps australis]|uniref:Nuclear architecture-related protein 1 n=1 Tax=Ophiocordyceps australis TaxID=1399860 RepID=A0A2C5YHD2_9HYPO|nr:hypothetical protein CDD82_794 [Ophiocordyceps australis]
MSAILSADDLNDFISPGVACIKPIETLPPTAADSQQPPGVILDGQQAAPPAQISLTDCLACSGCVTSAEAVLVSLQSHAEVLATLDGAPGLQVRAAAHGGGFVVHGLESEDARLFVASVSPQTRASLAAAAGVSSAQAGSMLDALLRGRAGLAGGGAWHNGFTWVLDTNAMRQVGLVLAADEVLNPASSENAPARPVLASSCPGWVCYAEKTHPHVLPHLSRVKSPQALTGTMLKTLLSSRLGIPPARIWHLAVMPCLDKKLEASRPELTDGAWGAGAATAAAGQGVRDVDCVITTNEVLMLAESRGIDFFRIAPDGSAAPPPLPLPDATLHELLSPKPDALLRDQCRAAGTSGGLLHYMLLSRAAQTPGAQIETIRGRNADVVEYLVTLNGEAIFKAARYYGFRNIQNLVRRLKPVRPSRMPGGKPIGSARARRPAGKASSSSSLEYSYVEVMACPGGCTNGGGQIKAADAVLVERKGYTAKPGPQEQKDWLAEVDEAYYSGEGETTDAQDKTAGLDGGANHDACATRVHNGLTHWAHAVGIGIDRLTLTSYREVVSQVGKDDQVVRLAGKMGGGW